MRSWQRSRSSIEKSSPLPYSIADIRESVDEILQTLKEEDDGEEPKADR